VLSALAKGSPGVRVTARAVTRSALYDEEAAVRGHAAEELGGHGMVRDVPALRALVEREKNETVISQAAAAIEAIVARGE
jgi:HEAT repeat protein